MTTTLRLRVRFLTSLVVTLCAAVGLSAAEPTVEFNRDVRPILSAKCYACHGPDAKEVQGGLRLDLRDDATSEADSSLIAIVPGKPEASELVSRIMSEDESIVMPPPESHKTLTKAEQEILSQWIAQGAEYKDHWALIAPTRPELPSVDNKSWPANEIDRFVLKQLELRGMSPSGEASKATLIRRVSLDLRGLPPSLEEVDRYLRDNSPGAYERMVDRMLASPHYGEKLARIWMDLARYGDTNGYHYDSTRQVWMWRDWVIDAYNKNMPFDQFTIEQLAGDLLPDATTAQRIASGFNRNTRYNEEGGADPEEWRVEYAKDRTRTLGQVWLGLTIGCAECHSHKYDPISQEEFYQLYAFFNSLDEPGAQGHRQKYPPLIEVPTETQNERIAELEQEYASLVQTISQKLASIDYAEPTDLPDEPEQKAVDVVWIDDDLPQGARGAGEAAGPNAPAWKWGTAADHPVHSGDRATSRVGSGRNQHYFTGANPPLNVEPDDLLFAHVWIDPENVPETIQLQFNDGSWEHRAFWGARKGHGSGEGVGNRHMGPLPKPGEWVRLEVKASHVGLKAGSKLNGWAFTQFGGRVIYDTAGVTRTVPDTRGLRSLAVWSEQNMSGQGLPKPVAAALKVAPEKRNDKHRKTIRDHYLEHVYGPLREEFASLHKRRDAAKKELDGLKANIPFQIVSVELPKPREARMLMRGDFLTPGEVVERKTPEALHAFPEGEPRNRLGLAKWVVHRDNPLTARVAVNRLWSQVFGRGVVETIGDFGHLGKYPTHPDLLDWLAVEFMDSGWDTKHVLKTIVMSSTYRQSSVNEHLYDEIDPPNAYYSRAPRFRLPAEEIRDSALKVAGLLSPRVGGPPAFPYQPPKYYDGKKGGWSWTPDGEDSTYRRGLYTFWRRTTPYPTFVIFDAPDRSECVVARSRTNTPLQALATMNDPQFVEAARVLGQALLTESPAGDADRLHYAFRRTLAREPSAEELAVLGEILTEQREHYSKLPAEADALTKSGPAPHVEGLDTVEHAAWTAVANVLLNLDETITRE